LPYNTKRCIKQTWYYIYLGQRYAIRIRCIKMQDDL
jgi:hypothetical protein